MRLESLRLVRAALLKVGGGRLFGRDRVWRWPAAWLRPLLCRRVGHGRVLSRSSKKVGRVGEETNPFTLGSYPGAEPVDEPIRRH